MVVRLSYDGRQDNEIHLSDIHGGLVSDPAVALGQLNVSKQIIKHVLNNK